MIAPIPKELGGSYTSGICKVAYELTRQHYNGCEIFLSSTNISNKKARMICEYKYQYNGYKFHIFDILLYAITHPYKLFKELSFYYVKCHKNPLRFLLYRFNIQSHIKNIGPDIIHVHTTESVPTWYANTDKIPTIMTMHGVFYRGDESQKYLGEELMADVSCCDYFTGLTLECKKLMKKYFHISDDKLTIIPNGVNTNEYYYDVEQRQKIRDQYKVGDSIVFITVASIQERKGQLNFLKILESLDFKWEYWILGDGPQKTILEEYCKQHKLENKVRIFGFVDSALLYKYYSAADIYAHPSTMEGQALCELEAYATGLRVVVNKNIIDTIATDVDDKIIYYQLDMNNYKVEEFSSWCQIEQIDRRSRCNLDWAFIAKKYEVVYKKILKKQ